VARSKAGEAERAVGGKVEVHAELEAEPGVAGEAAGIGEQALHLLLCEPRGMLFELRWLQAGTGKQLGITGAGLRHLVEPVTQVAPGGKACTEVHARVRLKDQ